MPFYSKWKSMSNPFSIPLSIFNIDWDQNNLIISIFIVIKRSFRYRGNAKSIAWQDFRSSDHEMVVFWNFLEEKFRENSKKTGNECKHHTIRWLSKISISQHKALGILITKLGSWSFPKVTFRDNICNKKRDQKWKKWMIFP